MMANKTKGQVDLLLDGEAYSAALDFNALAEFEDASGVENSLTAIEDVAKLGAKKLRLLMWCALRQHHEDISLETAGRIVTANLSKLGEMIVAAFPDAQSAEAGEVGKKRAAK